MVSEHSKPNGKHHSREYTAFTINQCERHSFNPHLLFVPVYIYMYSITSGKNVWGFPLRFLTLDKVYSHHVVH